MNIFVYGTLMSPELFRAVSGRSGSSYLTARLDGYTRHTVDGDVVPFIAPEGTGQVTGLVWLDVSEAQLSRLSLYEGAFGYELLPISVIGPDGVLEVMCYMPPAGITASQTPWSLAEWEKTHLAPALLAADELYSHVPLPGPETLRRMWPMIETRAWAKHRVRVAPATVRHDAKQSDVLVVSKRPPMGEFFRLQNIDVHHRTFDGGRSDTLNREAFLVVDAAMVLPYDAKRDKVLLIEQFRVGPAMRHDPNPWMLEPIAGIIDARETPEQAAHREAEEEAGLKISHLEPIGEFYASPGANTDYFYTYIGLCELLADAPYFGGLADEGEDIRLHPMRFDDAIALADSGEIQVGPLLLMLNWLARHRDRLRSMA
ncbi:NUDIX domain-containing protein [Yoonia maritima]|nr:NUDIX domain-containing protein [Yoonia maritima]